MTLRLPPQFVEGERAILGGILLNNESLSDAAASLTEDDFYREAHRVIWMAMQRIHARNEPVDWVTLTAELKKTGTLDKVGGPAFLAELADAVPSAANIQHYIDKVREKATRRRIIRAADQMSDAAYEEDNDIEDCLDKAGKVVFSQNEALIKKDWAPLGTLVKDGFDTIESLYERKTPLIGIPSGLEALDKITSGWQRSDLIIVAGRPSMGKTAFALGSALHAALEGVTAGVFSLEMSKEQLGLRVISNSSGVNLHGIRTGFLSSRDWSRISTAVGNITEASLWIDDTPAITPTELRTKARRLKRKHNAGLFIVDYLQLMGSLRRGTSREQEVAECSRSLKALAKELDVPIIALSQLSRKVEERSDKRPILSDLRESGAIEQDADVIIFLYRDEVYNKAPENPRKGKPEVIVGKQRNGPTGTAYVFWKAETASFLNAAPSEVEKAYMEAM